MSSCSECGEPLIDGECTDCGIKYVFDYSDFEVKFAVTALLMSVSTVIKLGSYGLIVTRFVRNL